MSDGINAHGLRLFKLLSIVLVFLSVVELPDRASGAATDLNMIAMSMSTMITAVLGGDLALLCVLMVLAIYALSYLCVPRGREFGYNRRAGQTTSRKSTGTAYARYRNGGRPGGD